MEDLHTAALEAILKTIAADLKEHHSGRAENVRNLAEAYAWLTSPAQPH